MEYRLAKIEDIENILELHFRYQVDSIQEEDKSVRGTGVLENIFDFSREEMSKRFPILVIFVNKINSRSYEAHKRKLGLDVIQEFEFNGNFYYEMVYDTSRELGV